ncbi:hypothetical protein T265_12472, partial [Opisthorchis viverrini]
RYTVLYSTDSKLPVNKWHRIETNLQTTQIRNLKSMQTYFLKVAASNSVGTGPFSELTPVIVKFGGRVSKNSLSPTPPFVQSCKGDIDQTMYPSEEGASARPYIVYAESLIAVPNSGWQKQRTGQNLIRYRCVPSVLLSYKDGDRVISTGPDWNRYKMWLLIDVSGVSVFILCPYCLSACLETRGLCNNCRTIVLTPFPTHFFLLIAIRLSLIHGCATLHNTRKSRPLSFSRELEFGPSQDHLDLGGCPTESCINCRSTNNKVPAQPLSFRGLSLSPTQIFLNWTTPPVAQDVTLEDYLIRYRNAPDESTQSEPIGVPVAATSESFILENLMPNTTYHISIAARTKFGLGVAAQIQVRTASN